MSWSPPRPGVPRNALLAVPALALAAALTLAGCGSSAPAASGRVPSATVKPTGISASATSTASSSPATSSGPATTSGAGATPTPTAASPVVVPSGGVQGAGAEAALTAARLYWDAYAYAARTTDLKPYLAITDPACNCRTNFVPAIEAAAKAGQRTDTRPQVTLQVLKATALDAEVHAVVVASAYTVTNRDGSTSPGKPGTIRAQMRLQKNAGRGWQVVAIAD